MQVTSRNVCDGETCDDDMKGKKEFQDFISRWMTCSVKLITSANIKYWQHQIGKCIKSTLAFSGILIKNKKYDPIDGRGKERLD